MRKPSAPREPSESGTMLATSSPLVGALPKPLAQQVAVISAPSRPLSPSPSSAAAARSWARVAASLFSLPAETLALVMRVR